MIIECRLGSFTCEDGEELERIIRECAADSLDDIWISRSATQEHPCLAVLVNRELACVHYFGGQEMYQSLGDGNAEGAVEFCPGGEVSELPAYTAVPLDLAIACVKEFALREDRPTCILWNEL